MPDRIPCQVIDAAEATADGEGGGFDFGAFGHQLLAQGDSWFSIGALPPWKTSSVVSRLRLERSAVIVNCARPGKVLSRMTDNVQEKRFRSLISGVHARPWQALLLSGVGNDLIAAIGTAPKHPPDRRPLKTPQERGPDPHPPAHYISEPGWRTFENHIMAVFHDFVALRDAGPAAAAPIVLHNYARLMPRPAGAGAGAGPWLLPALKKYAVPEADQLALSDEMLARIDRLVRRAAASRPNVHVADTLHTAGVVLAAAGTKGSSGDWVNEIHLTRGGYDKCARVWEAVLDPLLA